MPLLGEGTGGGELLCQCVRTGSEQPLLCLAMSLLAESPEMLDSTLSAPLDNPGFALFLVNPELLAPPTNFHI